MLIDEQYLWMKMCMTNENGWFFPWMLATNFFTKNKTKETGWKKIMLVCFEKLDTWNVEVILYINLIWNILRSVTSKLYRMLN